MKVLATYVVGGTIGALLSVVTRREPRPASIGQIADSHGPLQRRVRRHLSRASLAQLKNSLVASAYEIHGKLPVRKVTINALRKWRRFEVIEWRAGTVVSIKPCVRHPEINKFVELTSCEA